MHPHIETSTLTIKAAWSFGTAGASAICAIGSRLLGDALPPGSERLLDLGFAGIFIFALLYGMRVLWLSKVDAENKLAALEKEVREGMRADMREAQETRQKMVALMERRETRDIA